MIALFIVTVILLILIDFYLYRNLFSPVIVFCSLWTFICVLAHLKLYGFTGYSTKAVEIILLGVICFAVGNFLSGLKKRDSSIQRPTSSGAEIALNISFLKAILGLVCLGRLISLYYSISAFRSGASYMDVRGGLLGYNDIQIIPNPWISGFINYFCGPAETVLLPIAIILIIKKTHRIFSTLVLSSVLAGVVASGGRIVILYAIIQLIATLAYYHISISKKMRKRIAGISLVGLVGIIFLTTLRTNNSVMQSLYSYFSIPVALFSYFSELINISGFQSYGAASSYPFFYFWNSVYSLFGYHSVFLQNLVHYVGLPQNTWVNGLFPTGSYNAFSSMFYFFYMDFRIPGVALFSGIYGFITGIVFRKAYIVRNQQYFLWYLLLLRTLFGSFIIWQLGNTKFFVSMIILFIAQVWSSDERHILYIRGNRNDKPDNRTVRASE